MPEGPNILEELKKQMFLQQANVGQKKDRISHPVLFYMEHDMYIMSLAAFKSAIRHARAVTAVRPDNTAATIYDMITARFCCRLITSFLFVFFGHGCTS